MQKTNVMAPKINKSTLETYRIVITGFQIQNKLKKARFFWNPFLIADTSIQVIFEMLFLIFNKVKVNFAKKKLTKKAYIIAEILLIIKKVQIIDLKEFAKAVLDTK